MEKQTSSSASGSRKARFWLTRIVLGLGILLLLLVSSIYLGSEYVLRKTYSVPLMEVPVSGDVAAVRQGEHLIRIYHCGSCHGEELEGQLFLDIPKVATIYAPNLTQVVPQYTDAELARMLRHGVKKDGTASWMFSSAMYYQVSDVDVGQMIAYLRTLKPVENAVPGFEVKLLGRVGLLLGQFKPVPEMIDHQAPRILAQPDTSPIAYGKYLTMTVCSGCHGPQLQGDPMMHSPALAIAAAYPKERFVHLMKTGEGFTGNALPKMGEVSRKYLSHFTDAELEAIYAFIQTLPGQQQGTENSM